MVLLTEAFHPTKLNVINMNGRNSQLLQRPYCQYHDNDSYRWCSIPTPTNRHLIFHHQRTTMTKQQQHKLLLTPQHHQQLKCYTRRVDDNDSRNSRTSRSRRRNRSSLLWLSNSNTNDYGDDDDVINNELLVHRPDGTIKSQPPQPGRSNALSSSGIVPTTTIPTQTTTTIVASNPTRSILFSIYMSLSGAVLGPFLDTYHSLYHVLQYDQPITVPLFLTTTTATAAATSAAVWGIPYYPESFSVVVVTTTWVPPLFGFAGFIIGWFYILLDDYYYGECNTTTMNGNSRRRQNSNTRNKDGSCNDISDAMVGTNIVKLDDTQRQQSPAPPKILFGIAYFTFQYWLSGVLYQSGVDQGIIFGIMFLSATVGFYVFDRTISGFITSAATAIGGPLIEVGLLSMSRSNDSFFHGIGYHYTDLGETGFFPLWIIPIYFLGGPANGNLARGYWKMLSTSKVDVEIKGEHSTSGATLPKSPTCTNCNDTRCSMCPNCDGLGSYTAMGNAVVQCNACKGRGIVICRSCFHRYDEDPYDIDAIRELMSRISPD